MTGSYFELPISEFVMRQLTLIDGRLSHRHLDPSPQICVHPKHRNTNIPSDSAHENVDHPNQISVLANTKTAGTIFPSAS